MGQAVGVMRNASSAAWAMSFGWIIISALPRDLQPHTAGCDRCPARCRATSMDGFRVQGFVHILIVHIVHIVHTFCTHFVHKCVSTAWTAHVVMSVATSSGQMATVLMFLSFSSCAKRAASRCQHTWTLQSPE